MSTDVLQVSVDTTLTDAARAMSDRDVGAATVDAGEGDPPGIFTERDVLRAVSGAGQDAVSDHYSPQALSVTPESSLQEAAETMVERDFRHLLVIEDERIAGVVSIRDVVRLWLEQRARAKRAVPVREAMGTDLLTAGLDTSLGEAARAMEERNVGALLIAPPKAGARPAIFTERVLLQAVAAGCDTDRERLGDHRHAKTTFSATGWSLRQAAEAMIKGGFQHIVVVDPHQTVGIVSTRDVLRRWTEEGS